MINTIKSFFEISIYHIYLSVYIKRLKMVFLKVAKLVMDDRPVRKPFFIIGYSLSLIIEYYMFD